MPDVLLNVACVPADDESMVITLPAVPVQDSVLPITCVVLAGKVTAFEALMVKL